MAENENGSSLDSIGFGRLLDSLEQGEQSRIANRTDAADARMASELFALRSRQPAPALPPWRAHRRPMWAGPAIGLGLLALIGGFALVAPMQFETWRSNGVEQAGTNTDADSLKVLPGASAHDGRLSGDGSTIGNGSEGDSADSVLNRARPALAPNERTIAAVHSTVKSATNPPSDRLTLPVGPSTLTPTRAQQTAPSRGFEGNERTAEPPLSKASRPHPTPTVPRTPSPQPATATSEAPTAGHPTHTHVPPTRTIDPHTATPSPHPTRPLITPSPPATPTATAHPPARPTAHPTAHSTAVPTTFHSDFVNDQRSPERQSTAHLEDADRIPRSFQ